MTKQNYEKEPYGKPVMEIIELENDAITTSGCNPYGYCGDSGNCPPVGVCSDTPCADCRSDFVCLSDSGHGRDTLCMAIY